MTTGRSLAAALLVAAAAAAARAETRPDDPRYWNVLFYPGAPHAVHVLYGGVDDPAALLQALRENYPDAVIARGPSDVIDVNVLPDQADDVASYVNNALDRSIEWTTEIQPEDFAAAWFPHNDDAMAAVRALTSGDDSSGSATALDARATSDLSEAKGMLSVLVREQASARGALKQRPAISALVAGETTLLTGLLRFDHLVNHRPTIQIRMRGPAGAVEGVAQTFDVDSFLERWHIGPDSLRVADRVPFSRETCHWTPATGIEVTRPDPGALEEQVAALAARMGAVIDRSCYGPAGPGMMTPEKNPVIRFLVLLPAGTVGQFQSALSKSWLPTWTKKVEGDIDDADAIEERYEALTKEASTSRDFLAGFPAIRGLVRAETDRLRPAVDRLKKIRGRDAVEMFLSRGSMDMPEPYDTRALSGTPFKKRGLIPGAPYAPDIPTDVLGVERSFDDAPPEPDPPHNPDSTP